MIPKLISVQQLKKLFKIELTSDIEDFVENNNQVYPRIKKNGEIRFISSPTIHLKSIQKWIVEHILSKKDCSEFCHAYVKEKSIFTNAGTHIGNQNLLKMDIHNFFDSIPHISVKNIFITIGYNLEVSHSLALLCTYKGYVRQGFVSSPMISNIIMKEFDDWIIKSLHEEEYLKFDFKYSRYADDIAISSKKKAEVPLVIIKENISEYLEKHGFIVNNNKIKLIKGKGPKLVTGIVVKNNSISVPNKYKRKLLKELYYCEKYGVESHLLYTGQYGKTNYKEYLLGIAMYIRNTDYQFYNTIRERIDALNIDY